MQVRACENTEITSFRTHLSIINPIASIEFVPSRITSALGRQSRRQPVFLSLSIEPRNHSKVHFRFQFCPSRKSHLIGEASWADATESYCWQTSAESVASCAGEMSPSHSQFVVTGSLQENSLIIEHTGLESCRADSGERGKWCVCSTKHTSFKAGWHQLCCLMRSNSEARLMRAYNEQN